MKRELFGQEISQKSKSEFFSATDLLRAGNKYRAMNKSKYRINFWKGLGYYNSSPSQFLYSI